MTAIATPSFGSRAESPVLEGVSWQTYQSLLHELEAARQHVRVTYDRGRMVVMSPLPVHEKWKQLIGRMIEALAEHRGMPISAYGSTTWQHEKRSRGLEADQCYYVQHADMMRGKSEINLTIDPPPDLAVEIDVTHHPLDRLEIYAALRIPEVWRYDGQTVECFHLTGERYVEAPTSAAFRGFHPADLDRFLSMHPDSLDSEIAQAFKNALAKP